MTLTAVPDEPNTDHLFRVLGLEWIGGVFEQMGWAEDEIACAQRRHPAAADLLFHTFALLRSDHEQISTETLFRAHCRELLDRLATGADTRPGTAAEVAAVCAAASQRAPLTTPAFGLYMRAFARVMPEATHEVTDRIRDVEALYADRINDLETETIAKIAVKTRRLGHIECRGRHHGEPVACRYAVNPAAA